MSKSDTNTNTDTNTKPMRIEDLIVCCNNKTNSKSNFNLNSNDIPKNQKEYGHRKRIKP